VLTLCLAVLAFFGAGVDLLHGFTGSEAVGIIEDSGEMLAMVAAFVTALLFWRATPRPIMGSKTLGT
jgi:hypothetical protein